MNFNFSDVLEKKLKNYTFLPMLFSHWQKISAVTKECLNLMIKCEHCLRLPPHAFFGRMHSGGQNTASVLSQKAAALLVGKSSLMETLTK